MLESKVKGTVIGAAIGDALGTLVEEMDRETVKKSYGAAIIGFVNPSPNSVCPFLKKGQFSHETQMFMKVLEVYAEKGYFDEIAYLEKLIEWVKDEKSHRYPAGSHINAALGYAGGLDIDEARVKSCDIDGAVPAVAGGIYRWDNPSDAYEEGCLIASVTHRDETLIDTAGILAVAVSEVISGRILLDTPEDRFGFLDVLRDYAQTEMVKSYLDLVTNVLQKNVETIDDAILLIGNGSYAPEAFSLALYILLQYPRDFRKAVLTAVNSYGEFGGDTDAIAFVTGALSGGYLGLEAIPRDWVECLESSDYLFLLSEKILEKIE